MQSIIAAIILIVSLAFASPAVEPNGCTPSTKYYVAKYDDLPYVEPGPNPIPSPYNGLTYNIFQVTEPHLFIFPTSGNQYAMAFGGSGNISSVPSRQSFDLTSFSFACVSGVPQPECAITIFGYKYSGQTIRRVINFPRLDSGHPVEDYVMNRTTFGSEWRDLRSVGFSIARADNGGDMFGGLALDDVRYSTRRRC